MGSRQGVVLQLGGWAITPHRKKKASYEYVQKASDWTNSLDKRPKRKNGVIK
jgi:hypothetical protein